MLAHLELFHTMLDLRSLLQLAAHMEERGDRVTLISADTITLVGQDMTSEPSLSTSKGATIQAATAYRVLQGLKGHDAPEYAVTREELSALNARAVTQLESGDALRAFADTLTRITPSSAASTETTPERPGRTRRMAEGETAEAPAA